MGIKSKAFDPSKNIPQINSKADEWISWHQSLKSKFGKKTANALWTKAWSKRGSSSANTSQLRSYMSGNGINIDSSAWDKIVDMGGDIGDFITGGIKLGGYLSVGLIILAAGSAAIAVYNITKKSDKIAAAINPMKLKI